MAQPATTKQRAALIRVATPAVLEELFEMQNRICDLCGQPIQDLILAALDHSIPVIHFARGPLPIAEAIQQCNAPANLRAAHAFCNTSKHDISRDEWFQLGRDKQVGKPNVWTTAGLLAQKQRLGAGGRITGRITGRINKEKGLGIFAPGMHKKWGAERSLTGKPLNEKFVLRLYRGGANVSQIAQRCGYPPARGQVRVREFLKRAGIYRLVYRPRKLGQPRAA